MDPMKQSDPDEEENLSVATVIFTICVGRPA